MMSCTKFAAIEKGSLLGFADLVLDSGLILHDVMLLESNGKRWVNLPSKQQLDASKNPRRGDNGKPLYTPVVSIPDRARRDLFNVQALEAIDAFRSSATPAPAPQSAAARLSDAVYRPFDDPLPF
jgi:hypothetical protein